MRITLTHLVCLAASIFVVKADVSVSSPKQGALFSGSSGTADVTLLWIDDDSGDDNDFLLDNANTYTVLLCWGDDSDISCDSDNPIVKQKALSKFEVDASLDSNAYPNGYYYFQIYTVFKDGSNTIHYSNRFQLTGMTGPKTITATATGDVPGAATSAKNGGGTKVPLASFTVPYTLQTGSWRYAPMQTQPASTITATTWSRRFPTSAVTYYTSLSPSPNVQSTITPGWNYTAISAINWASVAPFPTYYYPASSRVSKAQLKTAKKKRWLD